MTTIRRAAREDIPALAKMMAAAFTDYAWTRWTLPEADYQRRLEDVFTVDLEEVGVVLGEVWTTEDCSAAAVWIPPQDERFAEIDWARRARREEELLADRLARADAAERLLEPHRPTARHWYLATTGVHPDHQRKGFGTAVMRPVLERCDAEGLACMTETSTAENVAFYERLGFRVIAEVAMPEGGPPVWVMWREPRMGSGL